MDVSVNGALNAVEKKPYGGTSTLLSFDRSFIMKTTRRKDSPQERKAQKEAREARKKEAQAKTGFECYKI